MKNNKQLSKSIILLLLFIFLFSTIILSGCISDENNYKPEVGIANVSDQNVNVTVVINNKNREIYNDTFFLEAQSKNRKLTNIEVPGTYFFNIITDNNQSFEKEEKYSDAVTRIAISIHNDKIEINIKVR